MQLTLYRRSAECFI